MMCRLFCTLLLTLSIASNNADVSHYFAPDFNAYYQQHYQLQAQQAYNPHAHNPSFLQAPGLYGATQPVAPTPAPVAPVTTTTTEFTLPEIVENRLAREPVHFIPLSSDYLPPPLPQEERPSYESPKPTQQSIGYYYPRPSSTASTTVKTTTTRPRPIVVQDPIDNDDDSGPIASQGYDYNAPVPVVVVGAATTTTTTPAPGYLPPTFADASERQTTIVEPIDGASPLRLRVKEMRCLNHQDGYFRSVLKVDSFIGALPTVDNDAFDKHCEPKLTRSYLVLDIGADDFPKCGVRECGKDLCLRVRFPAIRGMRTGTDAILTLHCKTQERVAVKTHALKMGVTNDVQARSIGTYAHGGTQNPLRTHVELLRKTNNGYTRHLEPNGVVQLGEELLLRAHVIAGDGWNHTKLTDVSLQRISASGELLNTAPLITSHGCLNPAMQSICAHAPSFDPPLGHKLAFRAVMFQGMRSGDELVLSMRITGCLAQHDCQVTAHACNPNAARRRKRTLTRADIGNGTEISEIEHISFRVVMRDEVGEPAVKEGVQSVLVDDDLVGEERNATMSIALIGTLGFVGILVGLALFASVKLGKY